MPKFSLIIPVYNVEKYIKRCLDSVFQQSFKDFEVIVVDDGTKDNSMEIVKEYNVKTIHQENQGLSAARNNGLKKATGEYIFFLDSDDWIEKDLLKELNKSLKNHPDIVRFQAQEVFDEDNKIIKYPEKPFQNLEGPEAFKRISEYHYVENAWCYIFKREFYEKEKFQFKKGTLHEDFGLIPLVIMKAHTVNSIEYIGYNYFQRSGSIMNEKNYEKTKKKVEDIHNHYLYLIEEIDKTNLEDKVFKSFIANSFILKISELNHKDYQQYKKILKELEVYNHLLDDSLFRKIKKRLMKISPKLVKRIIK